VAKPCEQTNHDQDLALPRLSASAADAPPDEGQDREEDQDVEEMDQLVRTHNSYILGQIFFYYQLVIQPIKTITSRTMSIPS